MVPRIALRTHYQVDEPALLRVLLLNCSSPVRSQYAERVAACLSAELDKAGCSFNEAAGRYAVDLARQLRLLNDNGVWTESGLVLHAISHDQARGWTPHLSAAERVFFFKVFLEADGAALLFLARRIQDHGSLPNDEGNWCDIANQMVIAIYNEALAQTGDPVERVTLRRVIERRRRSPYSGKSGPHQVFVHLQTLYRLGLVAGSDNRNTRRYQRPSGAPPTPLARLLAAVPDGSALQRCVDGRGWLTVAADVLGEHLPEGSSRAASLTGEILLRRVRQVYDILSATGVALSPIQSIFETLQITALLAGEGCLEYSTLLSQLEVLRKQFPREIRFHVDRDGRPAFLKLGDALPRTAE